MARIVMKFGGTSMAGIERIRHVAGLVKREAERGNEVAVVVSAMAGETDRLVQLCKEAAPLYDPREYDVVVASGEQVTAGLLAITLSGHGRERALLHGLAAADPRFGAQLGADRPYRGRSPRGACSQGAASPSSPASRELPPKATSRRLAAAVRTLRRSRSRSA